jgi:hypothetical protein
MNAQERADRTAKLKSEFVTVTFDGGTYDNLVRLMQVAQQKLDNIDPVLYELDDMRLTELNKLLAASVPKDKSVTLKLSHFDLFGFEFTSHLAEGFPQSFGGEGTVKMKPKDLRTLTDRLESYRMKAFPEQYAEAE